MSPSSSWSWGSWKGQCGMGSMQRLWPLLNIPDELTYLYLECSGKLSTAKACWRCSFKQLSPWDACHTILKTITQPSFPERIFLTFWFWSETGNWKLFLRLILLHLPQMFHYNISSPVTRAELTREKWH